MTGDMNDSGMTEALMTDDGAEEAMLAEQMAAAHAAVLDCYKRAARPDQDDKERKFELQMAARLGALFVRLGSLRERLRHRRAGSDGASPRRGAAVPDAAGLASLMERSRRVAAEPAGVVSASPPPAANRHERRATASRRNGA